MAINLTMAFGETEEESAGPAGVSLPTPEDTPYGTPSPSSWQSATAEKSDRGSKRSSRYVSADENISILDPRRFTPTLHANLVAEILALKRDQEDKIKMLELLEQTLHTTREDSEALQASLRSTSKENRSLKRQLTLLEGGTASTLSELARGRDEAVESAAELKKRLETAQNKIRILEEDSDRVHSQWAREKEAWEEEKRQCERKACIAEGRLKTILAEVAAFQASQKSAEQDAVESDVEASSEEHDATSVRTMSITSSIRFPNTHGKPAGHSLADELNFDGFSDNDTDAGGRDSALSNHAHMRSRSRDSLVRLRSISRGRPIQKQPSMDLQADGIINEDDETQPPAVKTVFVETGAQHSPPPSVKFPPSGMDLLDDGTIKAEDGTQRPAVKTFYAETGVQYSPPPSPEFRPSSPAPLDIPLVAAGFERAHKPGSVPQADVEIEANQRRKRVHVCQPLTIKPPPTLYMMVNRSSQTLETAMEPPSPPRTPRTPIVESPGHAGEQAAPGPIMVTSSTQTDHSQSPPALQFSSASASFLLDPIQIPSISIIPPSSRPSTPREPRLPQHLRDFGCQVSIGNAASLSSRSVQTEEIRIDQRLDRLPPHLRPSAVRSRPASSAENSNVPGNPPPRNPRRLGSRISLTTMGSSPARGSDMQNEPRDTYPGNNDSASLSTGTVSTCRPRRLSSMFAGGDGNTSDDMDESVEGHVSDSEYRTALAPRPKVDSRGNRRISGSSQQSPELLPAARGSVRALGASEPYSPYKLTELGDMGYAPTAAESRRLARSAVLNTPSRSGAMRKAVMIQNGVASHQRARSPSLPDDVFAPPFPIPTRASSRQPLFAVSDAGNGQQSSTMRGTETCARRSSLRKHYRASSVRRAKSATALPRNQQRSRIPASRSPPLLPPSLESSGVGSLPDNQMTSPRAKDMSRSRPGHRHQVSTTTAATEETGAGSAEGSSQPTGIIDAIAQTMVGDWMYKYIRRRKSFGVGDARGDENSNDRHKRWVWLAPYERSILWSSKQPASGSALMGKSGRKRELALAFFAGAEAVQCLV